MKNKVIQKFFTILLGLMMFSTGWAATQYCDYAVPTGDGDVVVSYYNVSGNTYGITIKTVGNLIFTGTNNCNCGVNQSKGAGIYLENSKWDVSATEATATFTTETGSVPTGFYANYVCLKKDVNSGKSARDIIEINLPNTDVDWTASCSAGPSDDTEAPVMTSASLVSKTHNSAVIAVEATDNVGVTKYVVYNNTATQGEYAPSNGKITVTGLAQQTAYTLTIKAKDAAGNESDNSKEVTFTTDAFVYYKYATGHLCDANFGDANGRILLTLTKMGTNSVNVLVEPNNAGTIVDWAEVNVNGVVGTAGAKSATPTQNIGEIALQNVTLPATGTFPVNITWHTPSLGGDGGWTTNAFQVATSELYVAQGVAVTGVSIPETATVDVNGTQTLTATITPANASNQNVEWEVISGDTYASVNANGVVTGKAVGSATVQVKTADGGFTDECIVTVVEPTTTTWWGKGSFSTFTALYSVTRNVNKTLTYELELDEIPTGLNAQINVKDDGVYNNLTSIGNNKYSFTTTETFADGTVLNGFFHLPYAAGGLGKIDVAYTVGSENVKPDIEVTGVSIDPTSAAVEVGKTTSLTAIIKPAFATNTNISWSVTAGSEYASVDANGVVTGLAAGAATVQVTTESGSKTATCDVNVVAQILLEPNAAPAAPTYPAEQVKAVYSATYSADCGFGEWGGGTTYKQDTYGKKYVNGGGGYFGMVDFTYNCSQMEKLHLDVWAATDITFRVVPIWVSTASQGVTVNIEGQKWNSIDLSLSEGAYAEVTDWSNVYQIKIDQAANETFWLNNVYFYTTQTKTTCALSASVKGGEGGTASVDNAKVNKGGTATFTAEAACGYSFVHWLNNNVEVSTEATYIPTNIQEDLSLVAEFSFTGPSEAATVKSYDLVVPIYNEGAKEGVNMFASWGQRTSQEEVTIAGHKVMKYGNINYQGIAFDENKRDVSAMKYVHLDIWSNKEGNIRFHPINAATDLIFVVLHLDECQWNSFDIALSEFGNDFDLTTIRQLKFDAQPAIGEGAIDGATILVQDIFFYAPNEFTLSEEDDNATNLTTFSGKVCNVTIGRTFEANNLYTLALPFDMDADQVEETFRACTMYALAESYWKVEGENMYIRFAPVTEFKANTPILFTPATDLDNIVAKEVTINNAACETATTLVTFHGTYSKKNLTASNYILAADQYLYPVVGDEYYINGMRGYFSWGTSVSQAPKMARVILHEEITTDNAFLRNEKQEMRAKKVLENGRFVIIRDGARYGVLGVEE